MISASLLKEILAVENLPSSNFSDKELLKQNGLKNRWKNGKILGKARLIYWKDITMSQLDGVLRFRYTLYLPVLESFNKRCKHIQKN